MSVTAANSEFRGQILGVRSKFPINFTRPNDDIDTNTAGTILAAYLYTGQRLFCTGLSGSKTTSGVANFDIDLILAGTDGSFSDGSTGVARINDVLDLSGRTVKAGVPLGFSIDINNFMFPAAFKNFALAAGYDNNSGAPIVGANFNFFAEIEFVNADSLITINE